MSRSVKRISFSFRSLGFLLLACGNDACFTGLLNDKRLRKLMKHFVSPLLHCKPVRNLQDITVVRWWWTFVLTSWLCVIFSYSASARLLLWNASLVLTIPARLTFSQSDGCSKCFLISVHEGWRPNRTRFKSAYQRVCISLDGSWQFVPQVIEYRFSSIKERVFWSCFLTL